MKVTLTFHGAAGCVTGSCYLLRTPDSRVLIDCGLFQGPKTLKALNYNTFPFAVEQIDAVLLTHAHIDHSGQLPKLVRAGYRGPIFATPQTRELCEIMLADCGHIQESEVEHLNRRNAQRGRPLVEPIYTAKDAARAMRSFEPVDFDDWRRITPDIRARWWRAGHMLGAASVEIEVARSGGEPLRLLFSGELGASGSPFLAGPEGPTTGVDHLIMESTYGGTERPPTDPVTRRKALADEMIAAEQAGGPLLMPAFAVERTQELLADLLQVIAGGEAPPCEMFLDSPLAIKACDIFFRNGWTGENNPFEKVRAGGRLHFLEKPAESDRLDKLTGWHVRCRPHPPPSQAPAVEARDHGPAHRLPGRGHPGTAAAGRAHRRAHPGGADLGQGPDPVPGHLFRSCRCRRPRGLGPRPVTGAGQPDPHPRGAGLDPGPEAPPGTAVRRPHPDDGAG